MILEKRVSQVTEMGRLYGDSGFGIERFSPAFRYHQGVSSRLASKKALNEDIKSAKVRHSDDNG